MNLKEVQIELYRLKEASLKLSDYLCSLYHAVSEEIKKQETTELLLIPEKHRKKTAPR